MKKTQHRGVAGFNERIFHIRLFTKHTYRSASVSSDLAQRVGLATHDAGYGRFIRISA